MVDVGGCKDGCNGDVVGCSGGCKDGCSGGCRWM